MSKKFDETLTKYVSAKTIVTSDVAKEALRLAAQKLPVRTKFVTRRDYVE